MCAGRRRLGCWPNAGDGNDAPDVIDARDGNDAPDVIEVFSAFAVIGRARPAVWLSGLMCLMSAILSGAADLV